ncbi:hypothetical protein Fmac_009204 [Flemingia macrophylla]|uniref:Uncharacterized protein n=1 Tax=Flemingia macrophylla TaxID=520843 RepID=A0ABD1MZN3_9FABA
MAVPIAIGTRGTIGSLVMKEIEYFTKFELERRGSSQKPQQSFVDTVSGRSYSISRPSFWVLLKTWKMKKIRGTSERKQLNRIPGYSYRVLKNDINSFQL